MFIKSKEDLERYVLAKLAKPNVMPKQNSLLFNLKKKISQNTK